MPEFVTMDDIRAMTGWSYSTVYHKSKVGLFPAPLMLGAKTMRWLKSDVDAWIEERKAERDKLAETRREVSSSAAE